MHSESNKVISPTNSLPNMGYVPALDGLRAIAVILVLLTHANFQLGQNGILGVDIFFNLSGFLITTLLLEEYKKHKEISLSAFYVRRTFRLFPALFTLLFFVLMYAVIFREGEDFSSIIKEVISSALYLYNISWAWGWGCGGKPLLLAHTWSLAVEEQFYLLWPCILIIALTLKSLRSLNFALVTLIIVVFGLKVSSNISDIGKSLIHESIYIGCLAALIRWTIGKNIKLPDLVALSMIALLIIIGVMPIKWYRSIHDLGGSSMIACMSSIAIISILNNKNGLTSRVLSLSPMIWIGRISYALYLWHVPIFNLFKYHSTLPPSVSFILKFVITFVVAELSWRFIEKKSTNFGRNLSSKILNKRKVPNFIQ